MVDTLFWCFTLPPTQHVVLSGNCELSQSRIFFSQDAKELYYVKGAPEKVLQQCTGYYRHGLSVPLTAKEFEVLTDAVNAMSCNGLRGKSEAHKQKNY